MKKGIILVALLLALGNIAAQVPGYRNGGLREELRRWWNGSSQQSTFHTQGSAYGSFSRDALSGTKYGFVSVGEYQMLSGSDIRGRNSANIRVAQSRAYRDAEAVAVSPKSSLLMRDVWSDRKTNGVAYSIGGSDNRIYGRRIAVQSGSGDATLRKSAFTSSIVGFSASSDGESSRSASGFLDSSDGGGNSSYGFGEVPHDDFTTDPPVGDGTLILTLMALVFIVIKRRA